MSENYILPEIWEWKKLGDIADLITKGTTPTTLGFDFQNKGINFIKIESISDTGQFLPEMFKYISNECNETLCRSKLEKNDILFSIAGALGRVALVKEDVLPANINQALAIIRIPENIINYRYLFFALKSSDVLKQLEKQKRGNSQKNLSLDDINNLKIPLPPIEEQERIVNIIEKKLKATEKAKTANDEQVVNCDLLKEKLYEKIFSEFNDLEKIELENLCLIERGGSPRPIGNFITKDPNGINWIKIGDADINSKYIDSTNEKITIEGSKHSRKVKKGDFILSNSMSFGRPYILNIDGCIHDGWLVLSNFSKKINKDFLYYILSSTTVKKQFENKARGAIVRNLNIDIVKKVIIPLPEIQEQEQIVSILETKLTSLEKAKSLITEQSSYINALPSSILRKAFNGEY